jgi:ABC-type glycerol-3-phosphate transport system substrate-binding protein
MKKAWVALLSATLLFSGWVGASHAATAQIRSNAAAGKITGCTAKGTVTFFHWGDKNVDNADKKAISAAESACPGLKVIDSWDQGNYDVDIKTKIGSGNAPDLFQLDGAKRVAQYAALGALAPLDSYAKRDKLVMTKTFVPKCDPQMSYKGHLYGLMLACSNQDLLFYNKEMFTARHVAFPTNKWTYKDFRAAAIKLTGDYSVPGDPSNKLRFGYVGSTDDFAIQQYLFEWGTNWVNKNATQCTLDNPKAVAALQWWVNLKYKDHGAPTAQQANSLGDKVSGFRDENFAMSYMGPWAENYTFGNSPGSTTTPVKFKWGVVVPPKGLVNNAGLMAATAVVVYAKSKNKNGAWWLDRFLTQGKGAELQASYGNDTPGALALYKDKAVVKEYGPILKVAEQANKTGQIPAQLTNYDEFYSAVATALDPMWKGTESVATATKNACAAAQQYLG